MSVGISNVIPYVRRFGITSKLDPYPPMALGSADITLMEMVSAYTTFPNDGVRVVPKFISRVTDYDGNIKQENLPELRDVIPAQTARIMVDLLQEPVRQGTAVKLQEMKRPVAGKTGTTNDYTDAWFMGLTLGDKETGGRVALPIWFDTMQQIYKDKKEIESFLPPDPYEPRVPEVSAVTNNTSAAKGAQ
jgi:penicillin-binding protein 1A